jgi:hypothetical protein
MSSVEPNWIREARDAVDQATTTVRTRDELEWVASADEQLDRLMQKIIPLEAAAEEGQELWRRSHDSAGQVWSALRSARESLGQRAVMRAMSLAQDHINAVKQEMLSDWRAYVEQQALDAVQLRDLVAALADVRDLAAAAADFEDAVQGVVGIDRRLPDATALRKLQRAADRRIALERQLPEAVRGFVARAARGGAPLAMLDDDVRTWLRANGASGNFRIVTGRPTGVDGG